MEANNAEVIETEVNESNTEAVEDTSSTTEASSIEADETATGEESSSEESETATDTESDLYYDIDGEEVSASTVAEWKKGHMLQSDYTKKRQADAEKAKVVEAKAVELDGVKEKLSDHIAQLEKALDTGYTSEELADLRDTDPSEYLRVKEEQQSKQAITQEAKAELQALKEAEKAEYIQNEQAIFLDKMPSWNDPKVMEADIALLDSYTKEKGFRDQDLDALDSSHLMLAMLDAAKYQKLVKDTEATKKQVDKAPNVIKAKAKETKPKTQTTMKDRFYGK